MKLSQNLSENIKTLESLLPIGRSFDLITRNLYLGETPAYWLGVSGMCKMDVLQQIFSDLQNPLYTENKSVEDISRYMNAKIGYGQATLTDSFDNILQNVLSGPSVLMIDGFAQAILLDVRSYPARGVGEPDTERITRGARDGFVETLLFNANLIRRRIRSPKLNFTIHSVGSESKTDVSVVFLEDKVNQELLTKVSDFINALRVTSLTMGAKSLEELLVRKRWWNPLPSIQMTERPDVACSYLSEGHILILVDNSPCALILPCTIFQFTQSAEDYYKSPLVGSYFRLVRFFCVPVNLLLLPSFLLITAHFPQLAGRLQLLSTEDLGPARIFFYCVAVEFLLDLFKYSGSIAGGQFSGALSIVGGLIIGDVAVSLNWASTEVLFYAAITLLTSLSLSSVEFADGLRFYRIFLLLCTGFGGLTGYVIALALILLSVATTPTFGGFSYLWPLFPWNSQALRSLLFRAPTAKAQPSRTWNRGPVHDKKPPRHRVR